MDGYMIMLHVELNKWLFYSQFVKMSEQQSNNESRKRYQ